MKYLELKSRDDTLQVSKLVIGTARSVSNLSQAETFELFDLFVEAGGNCIDIARAYSGGRSEEMVGEWMKQHHNRNLMVVSTKGCHPPYNHPEQSRLSLQDMQHDLDLSLKALQTDFIDIYWIHKDDPLRPVEEIIDGVNTIIRSGKIRMLGCSNWHVDRLARANAYASSSGQTGFMLSQIQWNLASTREEYFKQYGVVIMSEAEYAWYYQNRMPVFAFGSQAQGFFSKAASRGLEAVSAESRRNYGSEDNLERLKRVKEYAEQHQLSISAVVLAYITCNKLPGVAIFGSRNPGQLKATLQAADVSMDPAEADRLYSL
jgi:1-deoxyxylulose-5-phosphate synthase